MSAKVVFHLPKRFLPDYSGLNHLEMFNAIKEVIAARGGVVEAVPRDARLRNPQQQDWKTLLNSTDLHIIENGWVQLPNALNTTIAYIPPFWHLDPHGVLFNSSARAKPYDPKQVHFPEAMAFFKQMRQKYVNKRRSRYSQKSAFEALPAGSIAVFLQGDLAEKQGVAHCSTEEMLRVVAANADGRPVVVKAHPNSNQISDANLILRLMQEGLNLVPTDANVHDILKECAVTVSFNSAVAIEGFLHRKPAILFGQSDFHHFTQTVNDSSEYPAALARALAQDGGYAQFVYWYFHNNCLSLKDPDFAQNLLQVFENQGFDAARLGLVNARPTTTWKDAAAVATELTEILLSKAGIKSCEIQETLKLTATSAVFVAQVNGVKTVVKRFGGGGATHTVNSLKGELDYLAETMNQGPYQVNHCLFAFPDDGIAVLSFANGPRLGTAISKAIPAERHQLLLQSGAWLKAYTDLRHRQATFGPRHWIKDLQSKDTSVVTLARDRDLLNMLMAHLRTSAQEIMGCKVMQAATHGDFVGINAHYSDGVICGVDIQGECWLPLAKEAARFLVWISIHEEIGADNIHGINRADWQAFFASKVISRAEQQTTLPFLIGINLYARYLAEYSRKDIRANTRRAIECYLATPALPPGG